MSSTVVAKPSHSFPKTYDFDLTATELYTQETFETLQNQQFENGKKFFICVVRENEHDFIFSAFNFATSVHRVQIFQEKYENPLTRARLNEYAIYESSLEDPVFRLFTTKAQMENRFHVERLPIQANHLSTSTETQRNLMRLYATEKEKAGDLDEAKKTYHELVERFEDVQAMLSLYNLYLKDEPMRAFHYLELAIQKDPIPRPHNLFVYAKMLSIQKSPSEALPEMKKAAEEGSLRAITQLIAWYETGTTGISPDTKEAKSWRTKLPSHLQGAPISEILQELRQP